MRRAALLFLLLAALPALARPWQGIDPGTSTREDVLKKFGDPSRTVTTDGKEIIAYFDKEAIKGTTQVQFKLDPASGVVERIDVFPSATIDRETVENTYGAACPPATGKGPPPSGCYVKKVTDDFRTYLFYSKQGLVIFLDETGKTVHSFVFTASQKSASASK